MINDKSAEAINDCQEKEKLKLVESKLLTIKPIIKLIPKLKIIVIIPHLINVSRIYLFRIFDIDFLDNPLQ